MTKDEALKQALEALKSLLDSFQRCEAGYPQHIEMRFAVRDTARIAIDRAEEALAQPEQEPVAWRHDMGEENGGWEYFEEASCPNCQPLYTTPPQRKPLTPEWYAQWIRDNYQDHPTISGLCDAIIKAAHGIKGEA